jgi:hypothetical protein
LAILLALYLGSAIGRFERLGESIVENVRLLTDDPPPHLATRWELVRVLQTVRQPQEVVAGVWGGPSLFLRSAHIPLAWCTKDLGALAYANPRKLVAAKSQIQAAEKQLVWPMTQARMRSVAQSLNAQLIVLNRTIVPSDVQAQPGTLFQNEEFVVVRTGHPSVASASSFINPGR